MKKLHLISLNWRTAVFTLKRIGPTFCSAFGDILTFVDTRWYTLKFVSLTVKGRFQFVEDRSRTLLYAQCVEDFVFEQNFRRMPTNCP